MLPEHKCDNEVSGCIIKLATVLSAVQRLFTLYNLRHMEKQEQTRRGGRIESNMWRWNLNLGNMEPGIHQHASCAVLSACSELGTHLRCKLVSSIIENFVDTWVLL